MPTEQLENESSIHRRMVEKENIIEEVDDQGNKWTKVYFGGGAHFRNWLSQFVELEGEENVKLEEADSGGFRCYEESSEIIYRIWIRNITFGGEDELM
jgi:hypothetical protein